MNRHGSEVARDRGSAHPAAEAYGRLFPGSEGPVRIEALGRSPRSQVYRIRLAGCAPDLIAKRTTRSAAHLEHAVHDRLLPALGLASLSCAGCLDDPDGDHSWLFLEDAGDEAYDASSPHQRALAGRWLGQLHTGSAAFAMASGLPERGPRHYLERLRTGRGQLEAGLDNRATSCDLRATLRDLLALYAAVELRWAGVEALCRAVPVTIVHGDFAPDNVRLDRRFPAPGLLAIDWRRAGVGCPGVDLLQVDPQAWSRRARVQWPRLGTDDLLALETVGLLFRGVIDALGRRASKLTTPWPGGHEPYCAARDRLREVLRRGGWGRP